MTTLIQDINLYVEKMYEHYRASQANDGSISMEFSGVYGKELRLLAEDLDRVAVQMFVLQAGMLREMLENESVHWDRDAQAKLLQLFDDLSDSSKRAELERKLKLFSKEEF